MFLKSLIAGCLLSIPLGCFASDSAAPQGFLEGHLQITFLGAAQDSDQMPRSAVGPETYAEYPLAILSQQGKRVIARITADEQGNYRAALPPGAYILDVQDRAAKRVRARPQECTVVANETVHVDMNIVIGFRR
jgi:hypothetical protein